MDTSAASPARSSLRRIQVLAVTLAGAIAVVCFVASMLLDGGTGDGFRILAYIAAGVCAVIGVSFAVVGGSR
ncbi:hypothetical protein [Brachybacterium sp. FME24]|uniref:hypothetical protein n=1 Tax=Brachybacterium sp. FME24 TaxID=2742605 RepID=UPI00186803C7|nr:hypothetical protein [Brachybacterium sp. FME24]